MFRRACATAAHIADSTNPCVTDDNAHLCQLQYHGQKLLSLVHFSQHFRAAQAISVRRS